MYNSGRNWKQQQIWLLVSWLQASWLPSLVSSLQLASLELASLKLFFFWLLNSLLWLLNDNKFHVFFISKRRNAQFQTRLETTTNLAAGFLAAGILAAFFGVFFAACFWRY